MFFFSRACWKYVGFFRSWLGNKNVFHGTCLSHVFLNVPFIYGICVLFKLFYCLLRGLFPGEHDWLAFWFISKDVLSQFYSGAFFSNPGELFSNYVDIIVRIQVQDLCVLRPTVFLRSLPLFFNPCWYDSCYWGGVDFQGHGVGYGLTYGTG